MNDAPGRTGRFVHDNRPDHILAKMRLWEVDDPEVGLTLEIDLLEPLCNPHGSPHAAVLVALIDCGAARAAVAATGSEDLAGSDMTVRFLTTVKVGPVRVAARVLRTGRRTVIVQADVIDVGAERGTVATATMAFTRLDARPS